MGETIELLEHDVQLAEIDPVGPRLVAFAEIEELVEAPPSTLPFDRSKISPKERVE